MSASKKGPRALLLGMLIVLAGLAIWLIVLGKYPIGIALLAVPIALLPSSIRALKAGKTDDAG
jgi:hypothetical protein